MAARNRKGLSENTRARIQTSMIKNRLEDHIFGKCELSATQIRAAEILLKKTLPDLQSVNHSGEIVYTNAAELPDSVLADIATGGSTRTADEANSKEELH